MVSLTRMTENKRRNRNRNMGHKRKSRQSTRSTQSYEELFAGYGEPGKPAPTVRKATKPKGSRAES